MKLIVGLGNPGPKYQHTKHNVGFDIADQYANKLGVSFKNESKLEGELAKANGLIILKPQTFMNLSGNSISKVVKYYNIDLEDILIIYDDIDLPLAKIRIRQQGGSAGHNGVKSIIQHLGNDFNRIRIGVGRNERLDTRTDVLNTFSKSEKKEMESCFAIVTEICEAFHKGTPILEIMNKFN